MNGFLLLIPFLVIRFGVLAFVNKESVERATYFAPLVANEKIAYYIYQTTNIFLFIYLCLLNIHIDFSLQFYAGCINYLLGLLLCAISIIPCIFLILLFFWDV